MAVYKRLEKPIRFWAINSEKRERNRRRNQIRKAEHKAKRKLRVYDYSDFEGKSMYEPNGTSGIVPIAAPRKALYIDESLEPSMTPTYKHFSMAAITSAHDETLDEIVKGFPDVDYEYKYSKAKDKDPLGCFDTLDRIGDSDVNLYAKYLQKDIRTDRRKAYQVYANVLKDLVDDVLRYDQTTVFDLYVDQQTYLVKEDLELIFRDYPRIIVHDPLESEGMSGLRLVDFVAGASADRHVDSDESPDYYGAIRGKLVNRNAVGCSEWSVPRHSASTPGIISLLGGYLILVPREQNSQLECNHSVKLGKRIRFGKRRRATASKSIRPSAGTEALAADLVTWLDDFDHYEFADSYDSWEDAFRDVLSGLGNASYVGGVISYLEEADDIDYDDGLEARRRDILRRLRALATPSASRKPRGKGRGRP